MKKKKMKNRGKKIKKNQKIKKMKKKWIIVVV